MTQAAVLLEHFQQYNDPVAVDLSHMLYVNDLLSGVQTMAEATEYFKTAREIMHTGHVLIHHLIFLQNGKFKALPVSYLTPLVLFYQSPFLHVFFLLNFGMKNLAGTPLPSSKTKTWMNIEKELSAASQLEFPHWMDFDFLTSPSLFTFSPMLVSLSSVLSPI